MREVLTADAVYRALRERGAEPRFNYVADDLDPLRRVYPFLDGTVYGPLVGRPLARIPCPCGAHPSYADHFLDPFFASLRRLGVHVEVERAHLLYGSGRMNRAVLAALEARDRIAAILAERTGRQVPDGWSPFNPLCPSCGRIQGTRLLGFSSSAETVDYACTCGGSGTVPIAGGGKLTWRVDWPARWKVLGVTVEPFGKDHATAGGSYDTGVQLVREVFGGEPPYPIPYEWISLRGRGDMSSSKGNVLSIAAALEIAPPEALRYLVLRERPQRAIVFDPGLGLLELLDEFDSRASGANSRAIELSLAGGIRPIGIPFKHLVVAAQAARFDVDRTLELLERTGSGRLDREAVAARLGYARRWLDSYAPEELRFDVRAELPPEVFSLDENQKKFLRLMAERLHETMDGEAIHHLVYDLAKEIPGSVPARLFEAIYIALLGKPRGPRAGSFIAILGVPFCSERFRQAAASGPKPS
jgi:lysyl-tRNA synthetase class 1